VTIDVRTTDEGDHRLLVIDRPGRRNALTVEVVQALAEGVRTAPAAGVRAVVLTGEPPSFCSGGDLPSLAAVAQQGTIAATEMIYAGFHGLVRAIRDSPLPVIAAVRGQALGAGLDLALCCDLRVAAPDAVFESTWVKAGLVPGMGGAFHLPHVTGSTRAAELLLCGRRVDADTALQWGLVNEVAQDGDVVAAAVAMAAEIAALPAVAVARTKAALRRARDAGLEPELATLGAQQGQLLVGDDFQALAARMTGGRS
jgi:2-(1,2-epoxy-1,2-dihydrophenyl)acetyl-CoA isomerase